jgi:hemerythrin superfamily protein
MTLLSAANQKVHHAMDEAYLDFLEAMTRLDFSAARQAWALFSRLLSAHMGLEEEVFIPRYQSLQGHPVNGKPEHFSGDHKILLRACDKVEPLLDHIAEAENARRTLVENLDPLLRVGRILEHHDSRETEHFYPLLQDALDQDEIKAWIEKIEAALEPAP